MVLGRDTFAGDVLARLGVANVFADAADRYPKVDRSTDSAARASDLVVLPDEPYAFGRRPTAPRSFPAVGSRCVSGRHLTWYGPSLVTARDVLTAQLADGRSRAPPA